MMLTSNKIVKEVVVYVHVVQSYINVKIMIQDVLNIKHGVCVRVMNGLNMYVNIHVIHVINQLATKNVIDNFINFISTIDNFLAVFNY